MYKSAFILFIYLANSFLLSAQAPSGLLYIITDKEKYVTGETLWMVGYVLGEGKIPDTAKADILCIGLKKEGSEDYAIKKSYFIKHGACAASLYLPDTLQEATYNLVAVTNLINRDSVPIQTFKTKIQIGKKFQPAYNAQFRIRDSEKDSDSIYIDVKITGKGDKLSQAALEYHLNNERSKTKQKPDDNGIAKIAIPKSKITEASSVLKATINVDGTIVRKDISLPFGKDSLQINFYPEGGHLVQGIKSKVGWETKKHQTPVSITALLYSNNKIPDTIHTDQQGLGVFELTPEQGIRYYVRVLEDGSSVAQRYSIPNALARGTVLHLPRAITEDILPVHIKTTNTGRFSVALRQLANNETVIIPSFEIAKEKTFSIDMSGALRGLVQVTVLDEQNRPVSERLCFVKYDHKPRIKIDTDKEIYGLRDSVEMKVLITDGTNNNVEALFTTSCVHISRKNDKNLSTMENYYYAGYWLGGISPSTETLNNRNFLDTALLIKGWSRYNWQQYNNDSASVENEARKAGVIGEVFSDWKIKKPMKVILMTDKNWNTTSTDHRGLFYPKVSDIVVPEGKKIFVNILGNHPGYKAVINAPENTLLKNTYLNGKNKIPYISNTGWQHINPIIDSNMFNVTKQLEAVVVKAKLPSQFVTGPPGSNECGDYVCPSGYLNCPLHSGSPDFWRRPVKGVVYMIYPVRFNAGTAKYVRYSGCRLEGIQQSGVYTSRTFYGMDSTMLNADEKTYLSTIYWNPFVVYDPAQPQPLKFYTSDQAATYKITIQGVTANGDVFYADKIISIKTPEE